MNWADTITKLPGVGPAFKKTLEKLSIFSVGDLLYHIPFRYVDFSQRVLIDQAMTGQQITIEGTVTDITARRSFKTKMQFTEALLTDDTGDIKLIWFNQPYVANSLKDGQTIVVSGKVEQYKQLQLVNPFYEVKGSDGVHTGRLLPIYNLTAGLTNLRLLKLIKYAFSSVIIHDWLPKSILGKFNLLNLEQTLQQLHYPKTQNEVKPAQLRLAVDDALPQQIAVLKKQAADSKIKAPTNKISLNEIQDFIKSLPFTLTPSQKRAAWDILQDLEHSKPMNRLLQGDVSSGKTIVAIIAALSVAQSNHQTIILAPTEILARQHYQTFLEFLKDSGISIALLTRTFSEIHGATSSRETLVKIIQKNKASVIIGTHALLQDGLTFPELSLVVIDEQHRFGVAQRAHLTKLGNKLKPHMLTMSATPIPRTLALSLYNDLTVSQLLHVPTNRKPIITELIDEKNRTKVYVNISREINNGRQAFIITPKVETGVNEVKSVKAEYEHLKKKVFPNLKLGLVYGKMKGADKDKVMADFAAGKYDILVATTVIEIGIDIPNATVMLIEGAEHFGLAQLHQLRGRVGRSSQQSYCYVFTSQDNSADIPRLQIFAKNSDGFALAEYDLKTRGFGDLFGEQQSGFTFRFPQFITVEALKLSKKVALEVLKTDPELSQYPQLEQQSTQYLQQIHLE